MPASIARLRGGDAVVVGVRRADLREHLAAAPRGCGCSASRRRRRAARPAPGRAGRASTRPRGRSASCTASTASITLREQPFLGPAHRDDDAELRGAGVAGGAGRGEHLVEVEERIDVDVGGVAGRLRAEGAVLGAGARLGVDQALELDRRRRSSRAAPGGRARRGRGGGRAAARRRRRPRRG